MKLELLTPDELTPDEVESLSEQGVGMDDWDYLILAPLDAVSVRTTRRDDWNWETGREESRDVEEICPNEYLLERLLVGCCANVWYQARLRSDDKRAIGVAYHA